MINIMELLVDNTRFSEEDFLGRNQKIEISNLRYFMYHYLRENTDLTLRQIGSIFNRPHVSVFNGLNKFSKMMQEDEEYQDTINGLIIKI